MASSRLLGLAVFLQIGLAGSTQWFAYSRWFGIVMDCIASYFNFLVSFSKFSDIITLIVILLHRTVVYLNEQLHLSPIAE